MVAFSANFAKRDGMPTERMIMRKLKEILRLKLDCGQKHRQIQRAVGVSIGAVSKYCASTEPGA